MRTAQVALHDHRKGRCLLGESGAEHLLPRLVEPVDGPDRLQLRVHESGRSGVVVRAEPEARTQPDPRFGEVIEQQQGDVPAGVVVAGHQQVFQELPASLGRVGEKEQDPVGHGCRLGVGGVEPLGEGVPQRGRQFPAERLNDRERWGHQFRIECEVPDEPPGQLDACRVRVDGGRREQCAEGGTLRDPLEPALAAGELAEEPHDLAVVDDPFHIRPLDRVLGRRPCHQGPDALAMVEEAHAGLRRPCAHCLRQGGVAVADRVEDRRYPQASPSGLRGREGIAPGLTG